MMLTGRECCKLSDIKEGDKVIVNAGFNCMRSWEARIVKKGEYGLYVECDGDERGTIGEHYLEAQLEKGVLQGVYKAEDTDNIDWDKIAEKRLNQN